MRAEFRLDNLSLTRRAALMQMQAQVLLKNEVASGSNAYVPLLTSALRQSVHASINTPDPFIVYDCPYARYQYYGMAMEGPPPMRQTDRPLHYTTPGTGAQWFETWKAADGQATIRRVKQSAGRIWRR